MKSIVNYLSRLWEGEREANLAAAFVLQAAGMAILIIVVVRMSTGT